MANVLRKLHLLRGTLLNSNRPVQINIHLSLTLIQFDARHLHNVHNAHQLDLRQYPSASLLFANARFYLQRGINKIRLITITTSPAKAARSPDIVCALLTEENYSTIIYSLYCALRAPKFENSNFKAIVVFLSPNGLTNLIHFSYLGLLRPRLQDV